MWLLYFCSVLSVINERVKQTLIKHDTTTNRPIEHPKCAVKKMGNSFRLCLSSGLRRCPPNGVSEGVSDGVSDGAFEGVSGDASEVSWYLYTR